jgi:polar amino acid transport system permease protein/cystine transport system permease protein
MTIDWGMVAANWPRLWNGFLLTIVLSVVVLAVSTPIALLLALARGARTRWLSWPSAMYVNLLRALPALVILYFTFYALPQLNLPMPPFWAAVLGLTLASAAYLAEDIRAGLVAVGTGQWQAADALGLSPARTVLRIILPQAISVILPPYVTRAIIIVKGTSLASIVAVSELTGEAFALTSITYRPFDFLLVAAALYLVLTGLLAALQAAAETWLARRTSRPRAVAGALGT